MTGPAYGMTRMVEQSGFAADLLAALAAEGVDVDQLHPEYAAGQFEVSVAALDPVAAADRSVLVRRRSGRSPAGTGFGCRSRPRGGGRGRQRRPRSAWRKGVNLHAGGDGPYGLTSAARVRRRAAGALPPLAVLATPSPASFLRLQPSHWAGVLHLLGAGDARGRRPARHR